MSSKGRLHTETIQALKKLQEDAEPQLLQDLIGLFFKTTPERLKLIEEAIDKQDLHQLSMAAHSLKSSALNLGLTELGEACSKLEVLGKKGVLEGSKNLLQQVQALWADAQSILQLI